MARCKHVFNQLFHHSEKHGYFNLCWIGKRLFEVIVFITFLSSGVGQAWAATKILTNSQGEVVTMDDWSPALQPGDTIVIDPSRTLGIRLSSIVGNSSAYITITNPTTSKVTISNSTTSFNANITAIDCRYIKILGNNYGSQTYGIRLTNGYNGIRMIRCRDYEIAYLEIDHTNPGVGISHNYDVPWDNTYTIENVKLHNNYIHNITGQEAIYMGHWETSTVPRFSGIKIYDNIVDSTNWDGIQLSQTTGSNNEIYGNTVTNTGIARQASQCDGILLGYNATYVAIYGNYLHNMNGTGYDGDGIYISSNNTHIYVHDNVVWNTFGSGISNDNSGGTNIIVNNTVVAAGDNGIESSSSSTGIKYNLLIDNNGTACTSSSGNCSSSNDNMSSSNIAGQYFTDAANGDFSLTKNSPARNHVATSGYSTKDYDGYTRPASDNTPDVGAFEYHDDAISAVQGLRIITNN